jgi:hypothetical protein
LSGFVSNTGKEKEELACLSCGLVSEVVKLMPFLTSGFLRSDEFNTKLWSDSDSIILFLNKFLITLLIH